MKDITDCNMTYKIKTEAFVGLEYRDRPNEKNIVTDFDLIVEKPCFLEMDKKNHTFICATTGSGKSYLGGVIAEESIRLMKNEAKPTSFLVIDRLGIYSTLDKPNKPEIIAAWNKKTQPFYQLCPNGLSNIEIWIPAGEKAKYHPDMYYALFAIKPRNLSVYVFNYIFNIGENDPQSNLLKKCLNPLRKENPEFTMNDLGRLIPEKANEFGFKPQTADALFSKLESLVEMGLFDNKIGIDLDFMIKPNVVTIIDLSSCNPKTAKTVVTILMNYIVDEQSRINQLIQLAKKFNRKVYVPHLIPPVHILIDEAHNFFPKNEIFQKALKEGRNIGIKITAISQSPDLVDDLYENISHLFVGFLNTEKSINYIRSFLPFTEKLQHFKDMVKVLNNGCFLYYNMKLKTKQKIRVRPRLSLHTAITEIEDYSPYLLNSPEEFSTKKNEFKISEPVALDPNDSIQDYSEPIKITDYDKELFGTEQVNEEDIKFVEESIPKMGEPIEEPIKTIIEQPKAEPIIESPKPVIEDKPKQPEKPIEEKKSNDDICLFSVDYPKLNNPSFPTLRLKDKFKVDKIYAIKSPSKFGKAKCIYKHSKKLKEIPDEFLIFDTNTKTREEAIAALTKYYPELTEETECFIFRFCWVQFLPIDDKHRVAQEA